MEFREFKVSLQKHFENMVKDADTLFEVELDKDTLWDVYLNSFPEGTNKVFREKREHDCNACRHFVKAIGNAVTIKDNKVTTIWDFKTGDTTYQPVVDALSAYVKYKSVSNVFVSKFKRIGIDHKKFDRFVDLWCREANA